MGTFDLKSIEWNGETLACRPIEWNGEVTNEDTKATKYECACPSCGHLVHFDASANVVSCDHCHSKAALTPEATMVEPDPEPAPDPESNEDVELEPEEIQSVKATPAQPAPAPAPAPAPPASGSFVVDENPLAGLKIDTRKSSPPPPPPPPVMVSPKKPMVLPKSIESKKVEPEAPKAKPIPPKVDKLRSVQKTDVDKLLQKLKKR